MDSELSTAIDRCSWRCIPVARAAGCDVVGLVIPDGGPRICEMREPPAGGRTTIGDFDPWSGFFDNSVNVAMPAELVAKSVGLVSVVAHHLHTNVDHQRSAGVCEDRYSWKCPSRVVRHRGMRGRGHAGFEVGR